MTTFDKIELTFIIIELISIFIEIGLEIYSIKSSKQSETKILNEIKKR